MSKLYMDLLTSFKEIAEIQNNKELLDEVNSFIAEENSLTEAMSKEAIKDIYVHRGPVTRFGKPFVSNDETYVNAVSPADALNRASYIIKKKYGLDPKHSKVELNPDNIILIKSNKGKKAIKDLDNQYRDKKPEELGYIDDPSYNDEESGRDIK